MVDAKVTAEDIALSMLYSFSSRLPPIAVVVPESEIMVDDHLRCAGKQSDTMHADSKQKRTEIFLNILNVFGFWDDDNDFDTIPFSTMFIDVMPDVGDVMCWTK